MSSASQASKSPSKFWSQLRSVILVTFLTILIWLLAESRMVQTRTIEVQIVLVGNTQDPDHQFVVRPASQDDWVSSVDIELEGSLASLDAATRQLRGRIQMNVGDQIPARTGKHDLDIRSILREHAAIKTSGVSIGSVSSDFVIVEVDELVTLELPVRVDIPASVALDGTPRAIPQTVRVSGPSTIVGKLEGRELIAAADDAQIAALTPGRLETIPNIAITMPVHNDSSLNLGWLPVLSPSRVDIRLTVRSLTQNTTIDRLPIQILLAPGEVGRWNVALNPGSEDLVGIQLSGPADLITQITDGTITPSAVLPLSFQELERSITSKSIEILGLPSGVHVVTELPEASFTITPASSPTTEPAGATP